MSQIRVFQCPSCKEFIATDAQTCRFCSTPINAEVAHAQANVQEEFRSPSRRRTFAKKKLDEPRKIRLFRAVSKEILAFGL